MLYPIGRAGEARVCGELLVYDKPISPLGDINTATGCLKSGLAVKNKVAVFKGFTGSTVGPYIIYSLKKRGLAPKVLIVEQLDANVITSAVISGIPLFKADNSSKVGKLYEEGLRFVCIENSVLKPRGVLIAVEGIDGAGKTTVSKHLFEVFRKCGFRTVYTYEPYYDAVRAIFEAETMDLTPETEALLMVADRYSHFSRVIKRELEYGSIVILDRYKHSTIAYQGAAGLPVDWLREIQKYLPDPDIAVYLDIDPEEGLRRKSRSMTRPLTYFEDLERIRRAREIYLDLTSKGELVLVNALLELPRVVERVVEVIEEKLGLDLKRCSS